MNSPTPRSAFCALLTAFALIGISNGIAAQETSPTVSEEFYSAKRIVILGSSNTHSGEYVAQLESALLAQVSPAPEIINLGLPSETTCGLSEPIHPFPRPNVLDRLDDVLSKTKPDIVIAGYGMNDGVYHPFDETRFKTFQNGTTDLIRKVNAAGAKLILLTPPPFDPLPYRKQGKLVPADAKEFSWKTIYERYDEEVIAKNAQWVLDNGTNAWIVRDVYAPMKNRLLERRKTEPEFSFTNDGVHFTKTGHKVFAEVLIKAIGLQSKTEESKSITLPLCENEALIELVRKRQQLSHAAWLSHVGHQRPGIKPGLPMEELKTQVDPLTQQIQTLLEKK
ncbi:MAG: SGNH/GDSL hydrolase family protein [Mariniblastus sp.]